MTTLEEIERVIEQLPPAEFEKLSAWIVRRATSAQRAAVPSPQAVRDHNAFLNSYAPEDDGLYDDATRR